VVIVDQFEDVFTQCTDEAERLQFIRVLLAVARPLPGTGGGSGAARALVVLGLRADFYQDCANVAELAALLSNGLIESVNAKIRVITSMAFGFHNPAALIGLAMLALGGLRPALPGR
jgi:uncharacterized membrane protein